MSKKKKPKKEKNPSPKKTTANPQVKASKITAASSMQTVHPFWTQHNLHLIVIFVISCLLYTNTLPHQYAVDDSIVILRNQYTKKGFAGMKGIWGEDTFTGFFGSKRNLVAGGRYRPFSLATFAI